MLFSLGLMYWKYTIRDLWTCLCRCRERNYHKRKHTITYSSSVPNYTPYYLMVIAVLIFSCNVDFIVTRWLALCLGLPSFTGPTNKTKLESYWVHTFGEIMIHKRMRKIAPEGKILKCCLMRVETLMSRTFKDWT